MEWVTVVLYYDTSAVREARSMQWDSHDFYVYLYICIYLSALLLLHVMSDA